MLDFGKMAHDVCKRRAVEVGAENLGTYEWGQKFCSEFLFRDPAIRFHIPLCRTLDETPHGRNVVVICPRGYAKTTWIQIKCLRAICERTEKYILLIMDTGDQAIQSLETIANELENNKMLREAYGDNIAKGAVWNKNKIITKGGVCIEALGTGKKVRGKRFGKYRPTLIICDDPQNDEGVESPAQRSKDWSWLQKAVIKAGESGRTRLFLIGTVLHKDCMVCRAEKLPSFYTVRFRAIITWPTHMHLWNEWRDIFLSSPTITEDGVIRRDLTEANEYYDTYAAQMNEGAELLWEEKESLYELMLQWAEDKLAFMSEKQNDAWNPDLCEFDPEWFSYDRTDIWYTDIQEFTKKNHVTVGYIDLAKGKETKAHDYTATIVGHFDGTHCYVEADIDKKPVNIAMEDVVQIHKQVRFAAFGCEEQGFQDLAIDDLIEICVREGEDFPVVPMPTLNVKKSVRIARLSTWLKRGFFKFRRNCPHTAILIEQLYEFPNPRAHDDGPDALEGMLRLLYMLLEDGTLETLSLGASDGPVEQVVGKIS